MMDTILTTRLYLMNDHCFETAATLMAVEKEAFAADKTCFYPGGGGQPPDEGEAQLANGRVLPVTSVFADAQGIIWHVGPSPLAGLVLGEPIRLVINQTRRLALMRYHTVLHVLNAIAMRDYNAWITGVQIGPEYSRIDFKMETFTPTLVAALEAKVNAVLAENHPIRAYYLSEEEYRARPDLVRTLEAKPPIQNGRVRVVEIEGFDAQACGGTHVYNTQEAGQFSILRTENKGRLNKRLYVQLRL
jgi:misacylated tRNA(Ala) deacylase